MWAELDSLIDVIDVCQFMNVKKEEVSDEINKETFFRIIHKSSVSQAKVFIHLTLDKKKTTKFWTSPY